MSLEHLQRCDSLCSSLACVVGIAYAANYSGMSYTLALAHYTRRHFPAFSPVIGWLGVFLTGTGVHAELNCGNVLELSEEDGR